MPGAPGAASWSMLCTGARAALTRWPLRPRPPLGQALGWPIMSPTGWGPTSAAVFAVVRPAGLRVVDLPDRGTLGPASDWVSGALGPRGRALRDRGVDLRIEGPSGLRQFGYLAPWVRGVRQVAGPVYLVWVLGLAACRLGMLGLEFRVQFIWFGCWVFAGPVHLVGRWVSAVPVHLLRCWVFAGPGVVLVAGSCACGSSSSDVRHLLNSSMDGSYLGNGMLRVRIRGGWNALGTVHTGLGTVEIAVTSTSAFVYGAG